MEQQLLGEMVKDRDAQILKLASGIDDSVLRISKSKLQLNRVKYDSDAKEQVFHDELEAVLKKQQELQREYFRLQRELKHVGSLRIYRQALTAGKDESSSSEKEDPSSRDLNVLRLQCQLCKALHYIHIMHNEAVLYKKTREAQIAVLKKVIANTLESKSNVEMKLMNLIFARDTEKKKMMDDYSELMNQTIRTVAKWKEELPDDEESSSSSSSSVDEEDHVETVQKAQDSSTDLMTESEEEEADDDSQAEEDTDSVDESEDDDDDDDDGTRDDEYDALNAEERRKIFEKRRNELLGSHMGVSSASSREIQVE